MCVHTEFHSNWPLLVLANASASVYNGVSRYSSLRLVRVLPAVACAAQARY
jgi:hypothetical protein